MSPTFLKDERGQLEIFFILAGVVAALGMGLVVAVVAAILVLAPVALSLYIWRIIFPFARSIAEWTASLRNFLPFVNFTLLVADVAFLFIIDWLFLYALTGSVIFILLALPWLPILAIALLINVVGLGLAIILFTLRLCHWAFDRFRTWFHLTAFKLLMRLPERWRERLLKRLGGAG